jgi:hypothetical protein
MSQTILLTIWGLRVDLAVLLRGFCLFDFLGPFYLKSRDYETNLLFKESG